MWDVVIVDPPSFAPSKAALDKAVASYEKIFTMAAGVTANGGLLVRRGTFLDWGFHAWLCVSVRVSINIHHMCQKLLPAYYHMFYS